MKHFFLLFIILQAALSYSQDFRFGKVSEGELKEAEHPKDPDANAAILHREHYSKFEYTQDKGFYIVTEVFERIKIYNKEGYDWATTYIPLYEASSSDDEEVYSLRGYTFNLIDGKVEKDRLKNDGIFEEEKNDYISYKKFTMPNIKDGSVIDYKYTFKTPFIANINEAELQETIPINSVHYSFKVPEYYGYKSHIKGWYPFDVDTKKSSRKISYRYRQNTNRFGGGVSKTSYEDIDFSETAYIVNLEDVPALKKEAFSGNIENYAAGLKFELAYTKFPGEAYKDYANSWDDVSKTIYNSQNFGRQLAKSRMFEDDLASLMKTSMTNTEKAITIFEFVKRKMTWNKTIGMYSDKGLRDAYRDGSGNTADINLLLVSMLKEAGLDANPVLVSTKKNGIPLFPTRTGFNYVVAGVVLNGNVGLMDATYKLGEMNLLQDELLNWNGRLIREDGTSEWVNLYPKNYAQENKILDVKIDDGLKISGTTKNRFTKHRAMEYRQQFSNATKKSVRQSLENTYNTVEVSNIDLKHIDSLYQPVSLRYDFEALSGLEEIGDKLYLTPMLFLKMDENPFVAEKRNYPIDFKYPLKEQNTIRILIPKSYKIESIPESVKMVLPDNLGSFTYRISDSTGAIQISTEFSMNVSFITPKYYEALQGFFEGVLKKENEKVVLAKI